MTERKIISALKRVDKFKKDGAHLQALIQGYHLNLQLIRYILSGGRLETDEPIKKVKQLVKEFSREYSENNDLKGVLSKSNFKAVKVWLDKFESFFKILKVEEPRNVKAMLVETLQIFNILNISVNKMQANKPAAA